MADEINPNIELTEAVNRLNDTLGHDMQMRMSMLKKEDATKFEDFQRQSVAFGTLQKSTGGLTRAQQEAIESAKEYNKVMENYAAALQNGVAATKKLFNNLVSQDPSRSFTKYSDGIEQMTGAMGKALGNFGMLGKAIGGTIEAAGKLASIYTQQADSLLKANDAIAQFGTAGSFTTKQLMEMAHGAGITSKNMDLLVKPIQSLGPALTNLGGTTGEGVKAFADLTKITNKQREEYQRMGISQEQLIQNQADYIALQRTSGRSISNELKDKNALQKASLEYTDNLLALSAITGENVESIKKQQKEALAATNFQISQVKLENEARRLEAAGDKEGAEAKRNEAKARNDFLANISSLGDAQLTAAMQARLATGTWTEQNAHMARLGIPMEKFEAAIKKGGDMTAVTGEFMNSYNKQLGKAVDAVGGAAVHSEETQKLFGMNRRSMENFNANRDKDMTEELKKAKEARDKARKPGADPAQDARAKLTTLEIEAGKALDKLIASGNVLVSGFGAGTIAVGLLTAAAYAAAGALAAVAGKSILQSGADALKDALGKAGGAKGGPGPIGGPATRGGRALSTTTGFDRAARLERVAAGRAAQAATSTAAPTVARAAATAVPAAATAAPAAATAVGTAGASTAATSASSAASALSKLAVPLEGLAKRAPLIGAALSVGTAAVDTYHGLKEVDKKQKAGELTKEEARVEKGEVVGGGVGTAAGGAGGAWAGAAAGAAIGSAVPVVGTIIGGIMGAALGGWLGSKGGKAIGEVAGGSIAKMTADTDKKVDEAAKKIDSKTETSLGKKDEIVKVSIVSPSPLPVAIVKSLEPLAKMSTLGVGEAITEPSAKTTTAKSKELKIPKASGGGSFSGPDEGYPVLLHGDEDVIPRKDNVVKKPTDIETLGNLGKTVLDTPNQFVQQKVSGATGFDMAGDAAGIVTEKILKKVAPQLDQLQKLAGTVQTAGKVEGIVNKGDGDATQQFMEILKVIPKTGALLDKVEGVQKIFSSDSGAVEKLWEAAKLLHPAARILGTVIDIAKPMLAEFNKSKAQPDDTQTAEDNSKKTKGDSVPKAATGGVFEGPKSGYPVELHGKEMITPLGTGKKVEDLPTSDAKSKTFDIEEENNKLDSFGKGLKDSDAILKKFTTTLTKLDEFENKELEDKNKEAEKFNLVQDKLKSAFNGAAIDLSKFSTKLKVSIDDTTNKTPQTDLGMGGGTGLRPSSAPAAPGMGGGTGLRPSSAPAAPGMGGGTGITPQSSSMSGYLQKVALMESGGKAGAKAETSSASGLFQFTEGTWKQMTKEMGKNYSLQDRFDPAKSTEVAAYFSEKQKNQLEKGTGQKANDVDMYMAHFLGAGGATKFLNAMYKNPNAPASEGADAAQIRANASIFMNKEGRMRTLQEVYDLMANKVGKAETQLASGKVSEDVKAIGGGSTQLASADKKEIPKAHDGGVFNGPDSGYMVELHGNETVIPNDKIANIAKKELDSITKMTGNVTSQSSTSEIPAIDTSAIAKKSVKLFSEEMGPSLGGFNEYTGYNMGPMSTDLKAMQGMASKIGAYDDKTQTITDTDAWKKLLHSGIATNYDLGPAKIGTEQFGEGAGDVLGDRLKEIMEMDKTSLTDAIKQLQEEFKAATQQMVREMTQNAAMPSTEGSSESVMAEVAKSMTELVNKMSESNDIQGKILQYSQV